MLEGVLAFFQGRGGSTPDERRRLIRLRCDYQVQCECGEQRFPARVVDIGLNGMKLYLHDRLKAQSVLHVHHPSAALGFDTEDVICTVRWCRKRRNAEGFEIGVQYSDAEGNVPRSWVRYLLKELGFDEKSIFSRRKAVRAEAGLNGVLSSDDGRHLPGTVVNLGVGGALFEGITTYSAGSLVRLKLGPFNRFKAIELPGSVIVTRRHAETDTYQSSIRFSDLNASQVRQLGDYVIQLLKDHAP